MRSWKILLSDSKYQFFINENRLDNQYKKHYFYRFYITPAASLKILPLSADYGLYDPDCGQLTVFNEVHFS